MALSSAIALFGLHLIDADLCALAGLDNVSGNACAFDNGCAELCVLAVDNSQNLIKADRLTCCNIKLLNEDNVTFCNAILLAAGHDDSMLHEQILPLQGLAFGVEPELSSLPLQCGLSMIPWKSPHVNSFFTFFSALSVGLSMMRYRITE